ncbi:SMI1/KNR4 family protein [Leptothoe sp. PORK10 BA2]|uniref:SMI1/KNR4 family protein n=1 Tax=Leptothoe sp. PORK10 BA2 TaxID=3110254 RepID=UPI002B1F2677|nr:SMI1/KNR4 family protein [Leptothoe sp. PORK10 BA2]MEA5462736.1 SMI1/KNR4 family protein [Leptothoe sp. PORK10 BA2]
MSSFNWSAFLTQWSQDILKTKSALNSQGATLEHPQTWLGYPGASDDQIKAAEARLGKELPPSYRAFLKVSNGWQETTPFIQDLGSTEEINWFAVQYSGWLKQWIQRYRTTPSAHTNGSTTVLQVSDQDYFTYGEAQDCHKLRINYLKKTLAISGLNDSSIYLLNPEVVTEDGEWEAWFLADWLPGADRYPSFQALMEAEYINSGEIRNTPSQVIAAAEYFTSAALIEKNASQSLWQISSQLWPGIEIDQVCQWIMERVEQAVYSC